MAQSQDLPCSFIQCPHLNCCVLISRFIAVKAQNTPKSLSETVPRLRQMFGAQEVNVRRLERPYVASESEIAAAFAVAGGRKA